MNQDYYLKIVTHFIRRQLQTATDRDTHKTTDKTRKFPIKKSKMGISRGSTVDYWYACDNFSSVQTSGFSLKAQHWLKWRMRKSFSRKLFIEKLKLSVFFPLFLAHSVKHKFMFSCIGLQKQK